MMPKIFEGIGKDEERIELNVGEEKSKFYFLIPKFVQFSNLLKNFFLRNANIIL